MSKSKAKPKSVDPEASIYFEYFQHTKNYKALYGDQTVVLMQVGAFFEVYGLKDAESNISESRIEDFRKHVIN